MVGIMTQPLTDAEVQKVAEFADNPIHVESLSRLLVTVSIERLVECLVLDIGHGELLVRALKKAFAHHEVRMKISEALATPEFGTVCLKGTESLLDGDVRVAEPLVPILGKLIRDDDTGVGNKAGKAWIVLLRSSIGKKLIMESEESARKLVVDTGGALAISDVNETVALRIHYLLMIVGEVDREIFQRLGKLDCWKRILDIFKTDDDLLKMNAVELVQQLAGFNAGQKYIAETNVADQLLNDLDNPFDAVETAIMVCIACCAKFGSAEKVFADKRFQQSLQRFTLDPPCIENLAMAFNAIGTVMAAPEGFTFMMEKLPKCVAAFKKGIVKDGVSEDAEMLCIAAARSWTVLLVEGDVVTKTSGYPESDKITPQLESLCQQICNDAFNFLLNQPFASARQHYYRLCTALVLRSKYCAEAFCTNPRLKYLFLDFTSDQGVGDGHVQARQAKYMLAKCLTDNYLMVLDTNFGSEQRNMISKWVEKGPHWDGGMQRTEIANVHA